MNHIPIEVLREIFNELDFKHKLKCMLVCRLWYNTLDRFSLLCSLSIQNHQFPKFKDMLNRFPHRAIQVEYLSLNERFESDLDKGELCNMFPNLREIVFGKFNSDEPYFHTNKDFQFVHTTCKLEEIRNFGDCKLAP
jgi:hypothetical protein